MSSRILGQGSQTIGTRAVELAARRVPLAPVTRVWLWLGSGVLFGLSALFFRQYLLDDTFIYLRYLENWKATHQLCYNPGQHSYGASSIAYLLVLDLVCSPFASTAWPLATKLLTTALHLLTLVVSLRFALKRANHERWLAILLAVALAVLLAAPGTSRWLEDGMDTAPGVLLALLAGIAVTKWMEDESVPSGARVVLTAMAIAAPVILRIDGVFISIPAAMGILMSGRRRSWATLVAAGLLSGLWQLVVWRIGGAVVPDTALAKSLGAVEMGWVLAVGKAVAASNVMWLAGPALIVLATLMSRTERRRQIRLAVLALLPVALLVPVGTMRGQLVAGARYFLGYLVYCWPFLVVMACTLSRDVQARRVYGVIRWALALSIILAVEHQCYFLPRFNRVRAPQVVLPIAELQSQGVRIAAADIGLLGWETDAQILDFSGLVNGRAIAGIREPRDRMPALMEMMGSPDFLVVVDDFMRDTYGTAETVTLTARDGKRCTYHNSQEVAMRLYNVGGLIEWKIWKPVR